ncbi:MAG: crosslink repair DNA glycosylase YcaQ family protein [Candidatus Bipolaricaulis sp.]|nr:crosslink repair DNA glycosylase YcaQ family protein [Candidatus Bipolaricaulis sp.]
MALTWSREEARLYQLAAVGLHGTRYPAGEDGICEVFRDLRAVQLDPLPILGRNHDLVLQSRVGGTHPGMFLDLLHHKRLGFEYWDKMLCAIPIAEFPYFRALMEAGGERWEQRREEELDRDHPGAKDAVLAAVRKSGPLSTAELKELSVAQGAHRGWKTTQAAGAALEVLWNRGRISVSHRTNYQRYFDLTERVVPPTVLACPTPRGEELLRYLLRKRVAMVGLLPTGGATETWMFLQQARTDGLPQRMVDEGDLARVQVAGVRTPFYARPDAELVLRAAEAIPLDGHVRMIAPLDPLLWCRDALAKVWGFSYAWEVYKKPDQRTYGYYVLPMLHRDRFVGRFDGRYDAKAKVLHVLGYWMEPDGLPLRHPAIRDGFEQFLEYLGGVRIAWPRRR